MVLRETIDKREKKKKRSSRGKKGGYLPGMYSSFENGPGTNSSRRRSKLNVSGEGAGEFTSLPKTPSLAPSLATSKSHHSYVSTVSQVSIHPRQPVLRGGDPLMKDIESQILKNPSMRGSERSPALVIEPEEEEGSRTTSNTPTTPSTTSSTLSTNLFSDLSGNDTAPDEAKQEQPQRSKEAHSVSFVANFDDNTASSTPPPRPPLVQPQQALSVSFSEPTKTSKASSSEPHWIGMTEPTKSNEWITPMDAEGEYAGGDRPTRIVVFSKGGDDDDRSRGGLTTLTARTEEIDKAQRRCMFYGIAFLTLLTIVGAVIGITVGTRGRGGGDDSDDEKSPIEPTVAPTSLPTATTPTVEPRPSAAPSDTPTSSTEFEERLNDVRELIALRSPASTPELNDETSPQSAAAVWIAGWLGTVLVRPSPGEILQKFAVLTLYYATGGDGIWNRTDLWAIPDISECEWENVVCDWGRAPDEDFPPIVGLSLLQNGMVGSLPKEILLLTSLTLFDVGENSLEGPINPGFFTDLPDLEVFIAGGNELNGRIPTEVGMAENLKFLRLDHNILSGPIPSEVGVMTNLVELELHENRISGKIPDVFWFLSDLKSLRLDVNSFESSPLPRSFGSLVNITRLTMRENNLVGDLDHIRWEGLGRLESLQLTDCDLTGTIPPALGTLSSLMRLNLAGNHFVGTIPISLSELPVLTELFLAGNKLTGTLPTYFGLPKNLSIIQWSDNILNGTMPTEYGTLTNLRALVLSSNVLTGTLPTELGAIPTLEYINLSENQFVGELPEAWSNSKELVAIDLENNTLQGPIPTGWFNFPFLLGLFLGGNAGVTGSLPLGDEFCTSIEEISVPCVVQDCTEACNCTACFP